MIEIKRSTNEDPEFLALVSMLNADLAIRDGEEHSFYDQFNGTQQLDQVVMVYFLGEPVSCGALKAFDDEFAEVKRMFTHPDYRGKGLAAQVLTALEEWAIESGYKGCVLETGKRQPEAIRLYQKCGYEVIPNFEPYTNMENSVCFKKMLS
ncbi:GNAT family N-acetyltransferase [Robertkochia solimangrovi]|uniref:GNAT family N-acetyltransferase n=1 Tax=Robertkochia solimangrovi TaxID=2213046 RepID=UPI00118174D4|nr:GNAT family N-acetyltransferase [Robertkochia solimangrovi]TRZ41416.1 GNAT family N-acetyltransferase [Robertkochia solimangrovi]